MITKRKMESRFLIAHFMDQNMEILEEMDEPKYEGFFLNDSSRTIRLVDELMEQIGSDLSKANMRSAFRKTILLNSILKKIRKTGDE